MPLLIVIKLAVIIYNLQKVNEKNRITSFISIFYSLQRIL